VTAEQLALDATQRPPATAPRTPTEKWDAFVRANPHAKPAIVATTRALLAGGHRATANVVWEELRRRVHTSGDPYRWDNSLRAPMAAWMRDAHPDLARYMRTRRDRRG
jgi:hypothetical protein